MSLKEDFLFYVCHKQKKNTNEIRKLDGKIASKMSDLPRMIIKENLNFVSDIMRCNFICSLFNSSFRSEFNNPEKRPPILPSFEHIKRK